LVTVCDIVTIFAHNKHTGGLITLNVLPGFVAPVAIVGVSEKGYVCYKLSISSEGGHSSMPPVPYTPTALLGQAMYKLESNKMPPQLGALNVMLKYTAPEMGWLRRAIIANQWLFSPLLVSDLGKTSTGNAQLRSTFAFTVLHGSPKDNVLATVVAATLNVRIAPGDTIDSVQQYIRSVVGPHVTVEVSSSFSSEASPISDITSQAFQTLHKTVRQFCRDCIFAPFTVIGATDSRHFYGLSKNVFRFIPYEATREDLKRFHGINERISLADNERAIRFYYQLIRNSESD